MSYLYFCQSVRERTALWFLATLLAVSLAGAQPMPVQDIFPQPYYSTVYNGSQYLWASSAATGTELWKSDLAGLNFELVKEFVPGPDGTGYGSLFVLNGALCIHTNGVLYRSDGTAAGTTAIGNVGGIFESTVLFNGALYFAAGTTDNRELWKTNGTAAGTGLVKDINPGAAPSYPRHFRVFNGAMYFVANHAGYGTELWKSDGTAAGTVLLKDINPGAGGMTTSTAAVLGGQLYFGANDGTHGTELWKTNGTAAGTTLVKDINPGPEGSGLGDFTVFNGKLYFGAGEAVNGYEPWVSDGTAAGTLLLADLNPYYVYEPDGGPTSSGPGNFQVVNGDLYFQAAVPSVENPHEETTVRASNYEMPATLDALFAVRGATGKLDQVFTSRQARQGIGASMSGVTNVNGTLYFSTYSSWPTITPQNKLYASDGTTTRLVRDFARTRWVRPGELTAYNGTVYFVADDVVSGSEIWKTDGTEAGTDKLIEAVPGSNGTDPSGLFVFGNALYFNNGADGGRLWKYDLSRPQATPIRINAGGPAHTVMEYLEQYSWEVPGDYFGADAYFTGGTAAAAESYVDVPYVYDPTLYQTERRGEFSYSIPVPRGNYTVVMHFAEHYWGTAAPGGVGSRQFHINLEGVRRYTNYDIYARGGPLGAVTESITLDVLDGTLNIQFLKGAADQPKVNALEIVPVTPINRAPVLAGIGTKRLTLGQTLTFTASATDADGHTLSYSLMGAPAGASINAGTGTFTWTPAAPGTYAFWVRVSDNAYAPATDAEKITVSVSPAAAGTYRVNAGGNSYATPDARSFTGDAYFAGGVVSSTTIKDIGGTGDDYLYQTGRHGTSFSYNFPTGNGSYDVVLHFAETYFGNAAPGGIGSRKFHVNMEGARKLTDYDVFARAGGALKVAQETFRVTVSDGTLNVSFLKGSADNPAVKAIEVLPAGSALSINAGGAAFTGSTGKKFSADVYYASGSVSSIAGGEIANTTNDALYRNARVGVFSYGLPSGNGTFNVTLHFAETYWGSRIAGGAGSRKFNVYLENVKRLSELDVFTKAGGAMRALKITLPVTVSDGVLNLYFAKGTVDNPLVSAIEVTPAATAAREAAGDEALAGRVTLFPNPVQDRLLVTLPFPAAQVQGTAITDARGRVLRADGHRASGENGLEIGTESLPRGLFLLRIHAGDETQTLKFIKQ